MFVSYVDKGLDRKKYKTPPTRERFMFYPQTGTLIPSLFFVSVITLPQ
jgi:hypothetical protein